MNDSDFGLSRAAPKGLSILLPNEETQSARAVEGNLIDLASYIRHMKHALTLVDFCDAIRAEDHVEFQSIRKRRVAARDKNDTLELEKTLAEQTFNMERGAQNATWQHIVARDIAMTIHDFHRALSLALKPAENCPSLKAKINYSAVDSAMKLFTRYFPNAKEIRHAAGHPADWLATPKDRANNMVQPPEILPGLVEGCAFGASCHIDGRTVIYTGDGKTMTIDLTTEMLGHLVEVVRAIYAAISPMAGRERPSPLGLEK